MSDESKHNLKNAILNTIETEQLEPTPKSFFVCKETLMWTLWGLSVAVGALAVAVSIFVITYSQYALHEATHESFLGFAIEVLPYVWIVLFALMAFAAMTNMRCTKRGYRFCAWKLIAGSLVASLALGAVFHLLGFGYLVDSMLGKEMKAYKSLEKMERKLWQDPAEGRLLGVTAESAAANSPVLFTDIDGVAWTLDVSELQPMDMRLLESGRRIKVLGTTTDDTTRRFHACGAFPWMMGKAMKVKELNAERQAFVERVYRHKDRSRERLESIEQEVFSFANVEKRVPQGLCAEIAPVRRVAEAM